MPQYVTSLSLSLDKAEEQDLQGQGFLKIDTALNRDFLGKPVYLWYKNELDVAPITSVQVSFNEEMAQGLTNAGYIKIDKNLIPGRPVGLWYFKGTTRYDTPIVKVEVSTSQESDALKMSLGWERAGCNLSSSPGNWVYIWVKRQKVTYICDVMATNSYGSDADFFGEGYIRIDETTNTMFDRESSNFVWYRQTSDPKDAILELQVSANATQFQQFQNQKYSLVNVNLNERAAGNRVYLWYKKTGGHSPAQSIVIINNWVRSKWEKAGLNVIQENLNSGNNDNMRNLCVLYKK